MKNQKNPKNDLNWESKLEREPKNVLFLMFSFIDYAFKWKTKNRFVFYSDNHVEKCENIISRYEIILYIL